MANEKPKNDKMNAAEWAALNAYLASNGMSKPERDAAIGTQLDNRTRGVIGDSLSLWLRSNS